MQQKICQKIQKGVLYKKNIVFFLSIIVSLSFYLTNQFVVKNVMQIEIDRDLASDYHPQVYNLMRFHTLKDPNGVILNRYPPGYPFVVYSTYQTARFLGIDQDFALFFVSAFFIALTAVLIFQLGLLLYSPFFAFLAALLFMIHPYILQMLTKGMSENPFMFYLVLVFYLLFKYFRDKKNTWIICLLTGFFLGIAMLIRPIAIFLPIAVAGVMICYFRIQPFGKRILQALLVLVVCLLTILPWQVYNYRNQQRIILSDNGLYSMLDGISFNLKPWRYPMKLPRDVEIVSERLFRDSEISTEIDFLKKLGRSFIDQPVATLKLFAIKAARSWYGTYNQVKKKEQLKLLIFILYFSPGLLVILLKKSKDQTWRLLILLLMVFTIYFWCMTTMFLSIVRYMTPIFALWVILLPELFIIVRDKIWKKKALRIHRQYL